MFACTYCVLHCGTVVAYMIFFIFLKHEFVLYALHFVELTLHFNTLCVLLPLEPISASLLPTNV